MNKDDLLKEGFNEVESMATGDAWNFDETPVARGVYMGFQENVGPNESMMYHFIDEQGDAFSVWGNTILNDRFKQVEVGETVVIVYEGKAKTQDGKREYKSFTVLHKMVPGAIDKAKSAGSTTSTQSTKEEGEPTPF